MYRIVGKVGRDNASRIDSFQAIGEKLWRINRSAKGLLIVATNLNGFSLANRLQVCQTFYPPNFTTIQYILVFNVAH